MCSDLGQHRFRRSGLCKQGQNERGFSCPDLAVLPYFWPLLAWFAPPAPSDQPLYRCAGNERGGAKRCLHEPSALITKRELTSRLIPAGSGSPQQRWHQTAALMGAPGFLQERPGIRALMPEGGGEQSAAAGRTLHGWKAMFNSMGGEINALLLELISER
jgi:hypothetical protein